MRTLRIVVATGAGLVLAAGLGLMAAAGSTGAEIDALHARVAQAAGRAPPPRWPADARIDALPAPVRRWVAHTFSAPPVQVALGVPLHADRARP